MNTDFFFKFGRDAFHSVPDFLGRRFGTRVERVPTSFYPCVSVQSVVKDFFVNGLALGVTLVG
jgi:hypothetical protein